MRIACLVEHILVLVCDGQRSLSLTGVLLPVITCWWPFRWGSVVKSLLSLVRVLVCVLVETAVLTSWGVMSGNEHNLC